VTRVGTDADGDHLKLTTQSRTFANDLVQTLGSDIPAAGLATGDCTDESPAAAATGLSLPGPGEAPDFYFYSGNE